MAKIATMSSANGDMIDISGPDVVEVEIGHDGETFWVNVDGVCRLRCQGIKALTKRDNRTHEVKKSSGIHVVEKDED